MTLIVTREYEHLVLALSGARGAPRTTYLRLPHPSGVAVRPGGAGAVHVASTRNPNLVYTLAPAEAGSGPRNGRVLVPVRAEFYPGSLYLHDLAFVGGELHGNAVGQNAVVAFAGDGYRRAWWPRCIEADGRPDFSRNYLQLNSIAAGKSLRDSFFTASTDRVGPRRPGHVDFKVDGQGVVFSGATREPVARGLTRPHSARVHRRRGWVDNSGYGQVGVIADGGFTPVAALPGWTRGLCFVGDVAFVGTSRVIPRFRRYAPGVTREVCGVHALDARSGRVLAGLTWPGGSQVFGIESIPTNVAAGLPFAPANAATRRAAARSLFYLYTTKGIPNG